MAAEVTDFQPEIYLDHKRLKRLDRFSRRAVVSGLLAMKDACLTPAELDPDRSGVCLGSALGGGLGWQRRRFITIWQGVFGPVNRGWRSSVLE